MLLYYIKIVRNFKRSSGFFCIFLEITNPMKIRTYLLLIFSILTVVSCLNDEKKTSLEKREAEIMEKEKQFAGKEAEYQALLKMRDSLNASTDSIAVIHRIPFNINGKWNGRIVCTESNCSDYVVGDTRVDQWEITEKDGEITAKNLNKTGNVRVYKGTFDGSAIYLKHSSDPSAGKQLDMKIDLLTLDSLKLSGSREVQVNRQCLSKFSIDLTR